MNSDIKGGLYSNNNVLFDAGNRRIRVDAVSCVGRITKNGNVEIKKEGENTRRIDIPTPEAAGVFGYATPLLIPEPPPPMPEYPETPDVVMEIDQKLSEDYPTSTDELLYRGKITDSANENSKLALRGWKIETSPLDLDMYGFERFVIDGSIWAGRHIKLKGYGLDHTVFEGDLLAGSRDLSQGTDGYIYLDFGSSRSIVFNGRLHAMDYIRLEGRDSTGENYGCSDTYFNNDVKTQRKFISLSTSKVVLRKGKVIYGGTNTDFVIREGGQDSSSVGSQYDESYHFPRINITPAVCIMGNGGVLLDGDIYVGRGSIFISAKAHSLIVNNNIYSQRELVIQTQGDQPIEINGQIWSRGRTLITSHRNNVQVRERARIYVAGGTGDYLEIQTDGPGTSMIDGIIQGNGKVVINGNSDDDLTLLINARISSTCEEDLTTSNREWVSGNVHLRASRSNLIITPNADIRAYNSIGVEASWGGRTNPLKVDIYGARFHVTGTPNREHPLCAFVIGRSDERHPGEVKIRGIEIRCNRDTDGNPLNGGEMGFIQFYLDARETRCEVLDSTFYPGRDHVRDNFNDASQLGGGNGNTPRMFIINRNKGSLIKNIKVGGDFGMNAHNVENMELQDINAYGQFRFGCNTLENDHSETCRVLRIRGVLKAGGDVQIDNQEIRGAVKEIKAAIYAGGGFTISGRSSGNNASLIGGVMARRGIRIHDLAKVECNPPTLGSLPSVPRIGFGIAEVDYFTGERRY